jgi:TatD DNase family protein
MPVELVDTHCHLTTKELLPVCSRVIVDALKTNVTRMITVTCNVPEIRQGLEVSRKYDQVRVAAGIHPHEAAKATKDDLKKLADLWREPQIVAAGEIGLDFHYDYSPRDVQQTIFEQQLELASKAELPVIIHSRKAHDLIVKILLQHF